MGIRETLQEKKGLSTGLAIALVVLGVGGILWQVLHNSNDTRYKVPNDFFTVDDGKTYFTAPATNTPPFNYNGQEAVKVAVFECDGKKFVGYMYRLTAEARKLTAGGGGGGGGGAVDKPAPKPAPAPPPAPAKPGAAPAGGGKLSPEAAARAANPSLNPPANPISSPHATSIEISMNGYEYKRPGEKEWVRSTNRAKMMEIKMVKCPSGSGTPTAVLP